MARIDLFRRVSVAGAGLFVASVGLMHAVQPELSPVDMAVSYYMTGRLGWALGAGLISLGIASLSLALGLRHCFTPGGAGAGPGCSLCGRSEPSLAASFHRILRAAGTNRRRPPDDPRCRRPDRPSRLRSGGLAALAGQAGLPHNRLDTRILESLAILCALCLLAFFVCLTPVFENRAPFALGFVERVLLALNVGWLIIAAVTMPRSTRIVDLARRTSTTHSTLR